MLAVFTVLTVVQGMVQTVDTSTIPSEFLGLWSGIVYIFTSGASTVAYTFLRNILGYTKAWFDANPEQRSNLTYESNQLGATATRFALYVYGFTAAIQALTVGTPYQQHATLIAGAIGIILDLFIGAIKDLGTPQTQPTTTPSP